MCGRTATHKGIDWTCEARMHKDAGLLCALIYHPTALLAPYLTQRFLWQMLNNALVFEHI